MPSPEKMLPSLPKGREIVLRCDVGQRLAVGRDCFQAAPQQAQQRPEFGHKSHRRNMRRGPGVGERTVGKPQQIADFPERPERDGVISLCGHAGIMTEPVAEIAMPRPVVKRDRLLKMIVGGGEALDRPGLDRLGKTLDRLPAEVAQPEKAADEAAGRAGEQDLPRLREGLQSRREIGRLARDGLLLRRAIADHIADHDEAGGDADAHPGPRYAARLQPRDRRGDFEAGPHRALGIVLMRARVAEIGEDAVAHEFGDKAVVAGDDAGAGVVIGAELLAQFLGVEPGRQGRRADEIAEHHRQLPPLGGVLRLRTGRCGGRRRCLGGGQTGDGSEETLAVPERHTKLLEMNVGQLRQDIGVDFTRAKERLVLSETETSEPTPDIHRRAPRARTDHSSVEAACRGPGSLRTGVGHDDPTALPSVQIGGCCGALADLRHKRQRLFSTILGVIAIMHSSANGHGRISQQGAQGTSVASAIFWA